LPLFGVSKILLAFTVFRMASAYIVLGIAGSGRLEVLADLVANGTDGGDAVRVYFAADYDDAALANFLATVKALDATPPQVRRWGVADGNVSLDSPEDAPATVFLVTDGRANPVDQMEILAALLPRLDWEVARVLTVVHCGLYASHAALTDWYKACAHFSDAVLLSRREGLENANAVTKKFIDAHKAAHNPCLVELVKKGRVEHAAAVLLPEARRFSMIFDDTDGLDEMEFDEENLPEEPFDIKPGTDPYFERDDAGRRRLRLPDIAQFAQVRHDGAAAEAGATAAAAEAEEAAVPPAPTA
jgi:hypothetical protein